MTNEYFIEAFDNEKEVMSKINGLKKQGITEANLYIAVQDKNQLTMIHEGTGSEYTNEEKAAKGKFTNFLSGDNSLQQALTNIGVDEHNALSYVQEVKNGKILLFSDQQLETPAKGRGLNANAAYGDPLENENSPFPPEHLKSQQAENMENDRNNVRDSADLTADEAIGTQNTASQDRSDITPSAIDNASPERQEPRVVRADHNNLEEMGSIRDGIPSADPNMTDIPAAEQRDNDVPSADRSKNRLSDTESPEEWPQAASDRIHSDEKNQ